MTSNQDKTNFLDLNNEPYKPVVRDFTFGLSVASLSNKKRSKVSSDPIDSATKIIELEYQNLYKTYLNNLMPIYTTRTTYHSYYVRIFIPY